MSPPDAEPANRALARLVRDEGRLVLATLVRGLGDLQLAEDCVQDAALRALETWPQRGVPASPRAWLTVTARRRAVDVLRRESARTSKERTAVEWLDGEPLPGDSVVRDDLLRLVFTCCHPTLSPEAQVALALRTLCGLTIEEVARALLVNETTLAKRLTRARQKIARAHIPYRVPGADELPNRVAGVATTVYLLFNEGYVATAGASTVRTELVDEAIHLGRTLHDLMPDEATVTGLLALMLLQDARRPTRLDADGMPVLLADQDRTQWRQDQIEQGVLLLGDALRRTPERPDPYVVQAAIAACHGLARDSATTDWAAIVSWYDVLLSVHDTPVVRLNRAVAIGERDGARGGLHEVAAVAGLADYPLWHASQAELLARLGRADEAAVAFQRALELERNEGVRRRLASRLGEVTAPADGP